MEHNILIQRNFKDKFGITFTNDSRYTVLIFHIKEVQYQVKPLLRYVYLYHNVYI